MKAEEIEIRVARFFGVRSNIIVPNISWGLGIHECDLLIVSGAGYATEVEIKISLSDLKKDLKKKHGHYNRKIKYLYFAIPTYLAKHIEYIPNRAGILVVTSAGYVRKIANAEKNKNCRSLSQNELYQLLRLGNMRIWGLKEKILNLSNERNN